jgi:uncharacterized protein Yka (UPF0111/DUF47 family)
MKSKILAAIGEAGANPAAGLNAALVANDRVKYTLSLLQLALNHALNPNQPTEKLRRERLACGIDEPELDQVVAGARMSGGACQIPNLKALIGRVGAELRTMAGPVLAATPGGIAARLDGLIAGLPTGADDMVAPEALSAMMRADKGGPDSAHRLVMDLHRTLNGLQTALALEKVDGAATYSLTDADRLLVRAFMAGLHRTAPLKFDHPGLDTTATRVGNRLVIQNDIGTTDAHVIVINVEDGAVAITYTDVHAERLTFFQDMLKPNGLMWDEDRSGALPAGSAFYMTVGQVQTADAAACAAVLESVGSRLVFLIDWNRARKQLRGFLRGKDRLAVLAHAATDGIGHRGFLQLGGARLVNQAIAESAGSAMRFGDRLCDVLGDAPAVKFIAFTLRAATEGLQAGHSPGLIRDRIRVTLATHFTNQERQMLAMASDHAGLVFELATLVRDGLADREAAGKCARRARDWEHDADRIVIDTRAVVARRPDYRIFRTLIEAADDAADALEDAAHFIELGPLEGKALDALQILASLVAEASQEWIKALTNAALVDRNANLDETEDFLAAIDRIATLEHAADEAERALTASALKHAEDFRQMHLFTAVAARLEAAADALKHAALILRDHVFHDVIDG